MGVLLHDVGGGEGKEIEKEDILEWFEKKREGGGKGRGGAKEGGGEEEEEGEWEGDRGGCWRGRGGGGVSPMQLRKREEGGIRKQQVNF